MFFFFCFPKNGDQPNWTNFFSSTNYRLLSNWNNEVKCVLLREAPSANWQSFLQEKIEKMSEQTFWFLPTDAVDRINRCDEPEESEADGALLEIPGLPVSWLDDLLWQVGKSSSVETIALWTSTSDELVEECDGFLTWILTFILHHTGLKKTVWYKSQWYSTCSNCMHLNPGGADNLITELNVFFSKKTTFNISKQV